MIFSILLLVTFAEAGSKNQPPITGQRCVDHIVHNWEHSASGLGSHFDMKSNGEFVELKKAENVFLKSQPRELKFYKGEVQAKVFKGVRRDAHVFLDQQRRKVRISLPYPSDLRRSELEFFYQDGKCFLKSQHVANNWLFPNAFDVRICNETEKLLSKFPGDPGKVDAIIANHSIIDSDARVAGIHNPKEGFNQKNPGPFRQFGLTHWLARVHAEIQDSWGVNIPRLNTVSESYNAMCKTIPGMKEQMAAALKQYQSGEVIVKNPSVGWW